MRTLRLRLPPLTCLLVFEAAARHRHFTRAAKELGVTQSAVSRQISHLEEYLGRPLFDRTRRGIVLTEAGNMLAARLQDSFENVADAIQDIRKLENERPVVLSASTAFCHFWIVPRLARLAQTHPQIRVRIEPLDPPLRLDEAIFDVGVFYGRGEWSGTQSTRLLDEVVFPVASPDFLRDNASDLRLDQLPLLQYECFSDDTWLRWETWFHKHGGRFDPSKVHMSFRNYADLVDALLAGQGIALGWSQLLERYLSEGRIVPVGTNLFNPTEKYYLVLPANRPLSHSGALVAQWIGTWGNPKSIKHELERVTDQAVAKASSSPKIYLVG